MTLMTNDLNDHHDRMVVVEVFCFMIKKAKPDALSSARLLLILNPSLQSSHEFREAYYLN